MTKVVKVAGAEIELYSADGQTWVSLPVRIRTEESMPTAKMPLPTNIQYADRKLVGRGGRRKIIKASEAGMSLKKKWKYKKVAAAAKDAVAPQPHQLGYATPALAYRLLQELGAIKKGPIQQILEGL